MKNLTTLILLLPLFLSAQKTYYVAPTGTDANSGTIDKPFGSWQKLATVLKAGDIAYIRGGEYRSPKSMGHGNYPVDFRNINGTSQAHITISAYQDEKPVLNLDNVIEKVFMIGFYLGNSSYIDFKGLRITGLKQSTNPVQSLDGWRVDLSNQITFTNCEVDHMQGAGWRVTQGTPKANVITFTNCDAHHNGDPLNTGGGVYGNADGFDVNSGTVTYNNCRAWWNSDDGFDAFYNDAHVTYINCWSFWNGYIPGTFTDPGQQANGMGFKWGISTTSQPKVILRTFNNCLSFQNKKHGYDQNTAKFIAEFYNCVSYKNVQGWAMNYSMGGAANEPNILKNCISFSDGLAVSSTAGTQDHNTWNNIPASTSSFLSLDTTGVTGPRKSDGSLPDINFLKLSPTSNLIDKGTPVGIAFSGPAPDLGAFETSIATGFNNQPISKTMTTICISGSAISATYGVPAGKYTSNISQPDANNKALTEINDWWNNLIKNCGCKD